MDRRYSLARRRFSCLALIYLAIGSLPSTAVLADDSMTLRVNDAEAVAGGLVEVVIRTYAPRSISQGQICFNGGSGQGLAGSGASMLGMPEVVVSKTDLANLRRPSSQAAVGGSMPFVTLEQAVVFSEQGDATVVESFDSATQSAFISFESLSASINESDGPLAILYFRVSSSVVPDDEFDLDLDLGDTFVFDDTGQSVALEAESGRLRIRESGNGGGTGVMTFTARKNDDGWVRESGEFSNIGGGLNDGNKGAAALRVGDDSDDRQFKGIVSFETKDLPNDATILSATLRLRRGIVTGGDPFDTFGTCWVDVHFGGLGGSTDLAVGDFEAVADVPRSAALSRPLGQDAWSEANLDLVGLSAINKEGATQLRVYFDLDDNDNSSRDSMGYYSGDHANEAYRPQLVVTYQE